MISMMDDIDINITEGPKAYAVKQMMAHEKPADAKPNAVGLWP